jgi:hypothetical protein
LFDGTCRACGVDCFGVEVGVCFPVLSRSTSFFFFISSKVELGVVASFVDPGCYRDLLGSWHCNMSNLFFVRIVKSETVFIGFTFSLFPVSSSSYRLKPQWASRRAAIILSNSFPTSSRRHISLYADGESKGRPSLLSRINLAVLHARGYTPSLRHLVNRLCRWGARVFIDSAKTRPGIPSGPGVTSPRDAILFVAAKSSSWVTRSSSLHFMVSLRWKDGVRLVLPLSLLSRRRGNKVPTTLASNPGSMFVVNGGAGGLSFFVTSR